MATTEARSKGRVRTGIEGLDEILGGGLPRNRLYLIQGDPGTGKTTLSLQFLLEGMRNGETGLYVTLSETRSELLAVAESHGWSLEGLALYEIQAGEEHLHPEEEYTAFHPSEVELGQTVQNLLDEVERVKPQRVVIDSLSEMRLLARDPLRYRRQILALKEFFISRGCTIVFLDDPVSKIGEHQFQTLAHGVIVLERVPPEYGKARRRIQVLKLRGVDFHDGFHDCRIRPGGLVVYPRLIAAEPADRARSAARVSSGRPEVDAMLGGGPERGSSLLVIGTAGTGKTTLCAQYALAAARRGEQVAFFIFDERVETLLNRCHAMNMDLQEHIDSGRLNIQQIDPAVLSPGEFINRVRQAVECQGAGIVVIDSLNGYLNAMPGERFLIIQMHELMTYLGERDVMTLVVVSQHGLLGHWMQSPVDVSYLTDSVVLLRFFEHAGRVRKCIAAVKTRAGRHEDTIREFQVTSGGIALGEPLVQFESILSGLPRYSGSTSLLREPVGQAGGGGAS